MKTIRVRPVLLPTNYVGATLTLYHDGKGNYPQLSTNLNKLQYHTNQEIILISLDEKIEVGDTYCYFEKNTWNIRKCLKKEEQYFDKQYKLIATQSQLSPELINQLITEYNNGGMQDFEIEMEKSCCDIRVNGGINSPDCCHNHIIKPKLTNGFITVVEKESILYTEEEVYNLFARFTEFAEGCKYHILSIELKNWFSQNKKNNNKAVNQVFK